MHDFFRWIQDDLGRVAEDTDSWAQQFRGSLNLWGLTEGTHLLTLMVFAGTIALVDLRLLGVAFRTTPFTTLNKRVLPYTMISFVVVIVTGLLLFLAKPMDYYHSVWFRVKMLFLLVAAINIFWFHFVVQKNQAEWDTGAPPLRARLSGAISLASWTLIIVFGRFIAYNWYDCGKPNPGWVNVVAECASWPTGIVTENPPDTEASVESSDTPAAEETPIFDTPAASPTASAPSPTPAPTPSTKGGK